MLSELHPRRAFFAFTLLAAPALAASITGTVTNRTTNKPAAGDDVTLIRLGQGMQEAGHSKTDSRGHFTLELPDDGIHLVRVTHDKANYFQPVQPGETSVNLDVFSAAAKVPGVSTEAEVLHIQSDPSGNALSVVASFFVKNVSSPPRTQFSDRAFELYLPPGAVVEGSVALGPGAMSMPVKSPPVPLGDPDHYAFLFPIRPCAPEPNTQPDQSCGETRFQVSYRLPYTGSLAFAPRLATPTDTVAVMVPKSMRFQPASGATYAAATDELNAQAFVARNVQPGAPLGFTVSGTGQLPRDTQAQSAQQGSAGQPSGPTPQGSDAPNSGDLTPSEASARQRADTKPGVGLNNPLDSQGDLEPWAKYKWWILGGLGLVLAIGAGIMMRGGTAPAPSASVPAIPPDAPVPTAGSRNSLLQALRDELFALETDRLSGRLSEADYTEQRNALDIVLRRAIARDQPTAPASNS